MKRALKKQIVSTVCSAPVGLAVQFAVGKRLRSRGARFDVTGWEPHLAAAVAFRLYERSEIRFALKYLADSPRLLELGGSRGVVSSTLLPKLPPGSHVVSVEANPHLVSDLSENLARNPAGRDAKSLHYAIADNGKLMFDTSPGTLGSSLSSVKGVKVPIITLRELLRQLDWDDFSLLSDVEGAEASFIIGDPSVLAGCSRTVIELHETIYDGAHLQVEDLIRGLENAGFHLTDRHANVGVFVR